MAVILHKCKMFTYEVKFIYKFIQKEMFWILSCDPWLKNWGFSIYILFLRFGGNK